MTLLVIDTALEACSAAIVAESGNDPVSVSELVGRGHSERLFSLIEGVMDKAGVRFADLDRIAVTVGPGSFTGVRVGVAAARGLALVLDCPLVAIGTLEAHAASARELAGMVPVMAVLDARRDELYFQRFAGDGRSIGGPEVGPAERIAAMLVPGNVMAGAGADIVAGALPSGFDARIVHRRSAPDIDALGRLALNAPIVDAPLRPLYLRAPDAKPQANKGVARQ